MFNKVLEKFNQTYGDSDHKIIKVFSPSRINIIGEHIDYNGGQVLPCAIEIGTFGVARKNDSNLVRLTSGNMDVNGEFLLPLPTEYKDENGWMNFPIGVLNFLKEENHAIGGMDIYLEGNIPNGSGLSSSASLELLIGEIANVLYNNGEIPKLDLIKIGKRTENEFIGVNSGIMDQFIIGLGKANHAMLLDTNTLEYEYIPFDLKDNKIVIMSTNYRRELKDSKYNERRAESEEALRILQQFEYKEALASYTNDDLGLLDKINSQVIRNRAKHVIMENERVKKASVALRDGDIEELGKLLVQSDDSLRELYEVTGPYLDSLTKHANSFDGCLGARMTGAGFGGCAIAIVKEDKVDEFEKYVGEKYEEEMNLTPTFISSSVSDGVGEIK